LSTGEVEIDKDTPAPDILKNVFARSVDNFRDPTKPIPAPKKGGSPLDPNPAGTFGSAFNGAIMHGLQLRLLDLVGLTDPDHPKVYSGGKAFEIQRMSNEEAKAEQAKNPGALVRPVWPPAGTVRP